MAPVGKAVRAANSWYLDQPAAAAALLAVERFSGKTWDPFCGFGTIPSVFHAHGLDCLGTDLVDRGFRAPTFRLFDFLATPAAEIDPVDNIAANPPFDRATLIPIIDKALSIARHKVALLLPLTFLEGSERAQSRVNTPLARFRPFSWRISMPPGELLLSGQVKPEGGKKAFAWFVWEHGHVGPAVEIPLLRDVLEWKEAA